MKVKLEDAIVQYWSEDHEALIGVAVKTTSGYSLYKPTNESMTDWERLSSSKNPLDFDAIIYGKKPTANKRPTEKIAKNNIEDINPKSIKSRRTKAQSKSTTTTSASSRKVKKSFL